MEETGRKVMIVNANFRQGFGKEGVIISQTKDRAVIRYEDEGEVYQWSLSKNDFVEI